MSGKLEKTPNLPPVLKEEVLRFSFNIICSVLIQTFFELKFKTPTRKVDALSQPSTEVVGRVSPLLPYHIFFSGANTTKTLQVMEARHRFPTSHTNVEYYA